MINEIKYRSRRAQSTMSAVFIFTWPWCGEVKTTSKRKYKKMIENERRWDTREESFNFTSIVYEHVSIDVCSVVRLADWIIKWIVPCAWRRASMTMLSIAQFFFLSCYPFAYHQWVKANESSAVWYEMSSVWVVISTFCSDLRALRQLLWMKLYPSSRLWFDALELIMITSITWNSSCSSLSCAHLKQCNM